MLTQLSDMPEEQRSGNLATSIWSFPLPLRDLKVCSNHRKMFTVIRVTSRTEVSHSQDNTEGPCKISHQLKPTYLTMTTYLTVIMDFCFSLTFQISYKCG